MATEPLRVGFSTSHAYHVDDALLSRTAAALQPLDYCRFEVCREGPGVDQWILYRAFDRLNDHKPFHPEARDVLRRTFARLRGEGRETALWTHELWAPAALLSVYPELRTPRGDVDLAHPLMTEFLADKYTALFAAIPELDALVLTMTEVPYPPMHRFDSRWTPKACVRWLVGTLHQLCRDHGKRLVVRPFSAIRADYQAVRDALLELPDEIEVMLKSDPFDWHPFLPLNPALHTYSPARITVEFDLGAEYFGRGALPVIYPGYLLERLRAVRQLGIGRVTGRLDRRGLSALDREGILNVELFAAAAANPELDAPAFLAGRAATHFRTPRPAQLVDALSDGFEVVKKMFYVDGSLLIHQTFGDLEIAQRCLIFETLRPSHSLAHCADEWAILADRTTPARDAILAEKRAAVELAEQLRGRLRDLASDEPLIQDHAAALVGLARLYELLAIAVLAYLECVESSDAPAAAFHGLRHQAEALAAAHGDDWLDRLPATVATFADDLLAAFRVERQTRRAAPPDAEDFIPCGCPGEGHSPAKFTHGAIARVVGDRAVRTVNRHISYTLVSGAGPRRLHVELLGSGRLELRHGDRLLASHQWQDVEDWRVDSIPFDSPGGQLRVRIDRLHDTRPRLTRIWISPAPPQTEA